MKQELTYIVENGQVTITGQKSNSTEIIIPKEIDGHEVIMIGDNAFYSNKLTKLTIPKSCQIGNSAFNNNQLTELTIPEGCKIGNGAFYHNKLTLVNIHEGVKIGVGAFRSNQLTSVNIPEGCHIGEYAFRSNKLTKLTIPEGCHIGDYAFSSNKLTELTIPEGCQIGNSAFDNNNNLNQVTISNSIVKTKCIDSYLMTIHNSKTVQDFIIHECSYFAQKETVYVAERSGIYAHGDTVKDAIEDCNFKFIQQTVDTADIIKRIKSEDIVTMTDYRLLTGACAQGCKRYMSTNNLNQSYTVKESLSILKGAYGYEKFEEALY